MADQYLEDRLLTASEAGAYLGYKESTMRQYASDETVPSVKLPTGALRFRLSDLNRWIAEHRPEEKKAS